MARSFTTFIPDTDCIGDSLNAININYSNLDEECQRLDTRITSTSSSLITTSQILSVLNPVDTTTVDLTWTASTRSLQADVKNSSISTTQLAASAVTAEKLYGEQTGSAPIYGCRAWVNFNGTNTTGTSAVQTIRQQGNVASVVRIGSSTGLFRVTFTIPMPHSNYCVVGGLNELGTGTGSENDGLVSAYDLQTTGFRIATPRGDAALKNHQNVYVTVIG